MNMSADPQKEVWIAMKRGKQIGVGYGRVGADELKRHVRSDDHELVLGLTELKFVGEPVKMIGIKAALPTKNTILVRHGIVEHDDLDRQISLRLEAVTGKVIGDVGRAETVAGRL